MMEYKGYTASYKYSIEDKVFHGRVQDIGKDVVIFESNTEEGIEKEFRLAIDDYIEFCVELGFSPELLF